MSGHFKVIHLLMSNVFNIIHFVYSCFRSSHITMLQAIQGHFMIIHPMITDMKGL